MGRIASIFCLFVLLVVATPAEASRYGVQVGAFREFERAERVQEILEDAGYNSYVSEDGTWKRVRVGPFATRAEAEAEVAMLWPFLVARFGPLEFPRSWVVVEDREVRNAPLAPSATGEPFRFFAGWDASVDSTAAYILESARSLLGVSYTWGGTTPDGFDCSGFVQYLFGRAGYVLPRQAKNQFRVGEEVQTGALLPGDLVFFSTYTSGPSHVGIYLGNGEFIHASSGSGEVTITPMTKRYYHNRYLGARRILSLDPGTVRSMTRLVNR